MAGIEDYLKEEKETPSKDVSKDDDVEIKRESLSILASLGTTKDYLGVNMSLGDMKKLSGKDVEKYFNRYQVALGQQVTGGLVESTIQLATRAISCVVPIDDSDALCKDLQNDELVKRELSNIAGLLALRGGRMVALASALFQVCKHVKLREPKETDNKIQEEQSTTEHALEQN